MSLPGAPPLPSPGFPFSLQPFQPRAAACGRAPGLCSRLVLPARRAQPPIASLPLLPVPLCRLLPLSQGAGLPLTSRPLFCVLCLYSVVHWPPVLRLYGSGRGVPPAGRPRPPGRRGGALPHCAQDPCACLAPRSPSRPPSHHVCTPAAWHRALSTPQRVKHCPPLVGGGPRQTPASAGAVATGVTQNEKVALVATWPGAEGRGQVPSETGALSAWRRCLSAGRCRSGRDRGDVARRSRGTGCRRGVGRGCAAGDAERWLARDPEGASRTVLWRPARELDVGLRVGQGCRGCERGTGLAPERAEGRPWKGGDLSQREGHLEEGVGRGRERRARLLRGVGRYGAAGGWPGGLPGFPSARVCAGG